MVSGVAHATIRVFDAAMEHADFAAKIKIDRYRELARVARSCGETAHDTEASALWLKIAEQYEQLVEMVAARPALHRD